MNEDFYNWLSECPVVWERIEEDDDSVSYFFMKPEDKED